MGVARGRTKDERSKDEGRRTKDESLRWREGEAYKLELCASGSSLAEGLFIRPAV